MDGQKQFKDMTGKKFGYLTVIRRDGQYRTTTRAAWLIRCVCGKEWTVDGSSLRSGKMRSCGCKKGEQRITHGLSKEPIYAIWCTMKARCLNPNHHFYYRYGGRGIQVDPRWMDFELFVKDMGKPKPGTTLDRIDNDGNYTKSNCRWATRKQQANNTRRNVVIKTSQGSMSIEDAANYAGITYNAMQKRIEICLSGDDLLLPKYSKLPKCTTC